MGRRRGLEPRQANVDGRANSHWEAAAVAPRPGAGPVTRVSALPAQPIDSPAALAHLLFAMESLVFPRRSGPTSSAAELARPLAEGLIKSPKPLMKKQAVKRHHHKHNLRHRYEFLETLGKGTYGKVKKARESSGRLVSAAPSRGAGRARAWPPARSGGGGRGLARCWAERPAWSLPG
ncbi:hypothetical protein P7K49_035796 [Saguinus oedipus]|uniref:Uncharacterized protein n=1 Tax=Saguinus oedipus TaxID=9490 RepID=A0ABQ9TNM7_SAGOE|nr:hypothetical protein P7K49_035796 [Saguinus oedipus]